MIIPLKFYAFRLLPLISLLLLSRSVFSQVPDLFHDRNKLEARVAADTRDKQHFAALKALITLKALEYPRSLDGIRPMVSQLKELGRELGPRYEIEALTANQVMYTIVCPRLTPEQRDSGALYFYQIRDLIGEPASRQEAEILLQAHLNMFTFCVGTWNKNDSIFRIIEHAPKIPLLSDSARMVANMYYIVKLHTREGGTQRGNEVIQENLRLAENLPGAYSAKYRFYTLMADFQKQFTGDQERVIDYSRKAAAVLEKITEATVNTRVENLQFQVTAYLEMEEYPTALKIVDSISAILAPMVEAGDLESAEYELCALTDYLEIFELTEQPGGEKYISQGEAILNLYGEEIYAPFKASFQGNAGVYLFSQGKNKEAAAYFGPFIEEAPSHTYRVEMRKLYAKSLRLQAAIDEEAGDLVASVAHYRQALETEDQLRKIDIDLGTAQAAFSLDVAEYERASKNAEQATEMERQASAARSRLFWLALLAGGLVMAVLAWAYQRSRRDGQKLSAQKALVDQSLSEKEVLLREIHHRVKNNLQIISSLLQKQARLSSDGDAKKLAKEGQERIQSMALVHENLYQSEQLSGVNIRTYLEDLGANISRSHSRPGSGIQLELAVADEYLDLDTAIPVGLILNELLTNAYKYAFPEGEAGLIKVSFQKPGDQFRLQISDNGVGLPADHTERSRKSLGHNLITGLVRQLEGSIKWLTPERGTAVQIEF